MQTLAGGREQLGELTHIQWRRLSTDGEREVVVQFADSASAGQKRYVVRTLDELPRSLAERLRKEWCEPTRDDLAPCTERPPPAQCVAPSGPPNSEQDL